MLERIGRAAGYETDFIDDAFDVFDEVRNDVDIFPGVIPALESLREHYVLIAGITPGKIFHRIAPRWTRVEFEFTMVVDHRTVGNT